MYKPVHESVAFVILFISTLAFGALLGVDFANKSMEGKAIEHNCGQHNPKTGAFEWLPAT